MCMRDPSFWFDSDMVAGFACVCLLAESACLDFCIWACLPLLLASSPNADVSFEIATLIT